MLSKNLGALLAIFAAIALGWPLPLLPLQILWINLVTDVFPAMALAVEPPAPGLMQRAPRRSDASLLAGPFLVLIAWQGTMLGMFLLCSYWWALHRYGAGPHARTIVMLTLIGGQVGHLFNCRSRRQSAFSHLFTNPFVWAAVGIVTTLQMMAIYFAPLARVLDTARPAGDDWLILIASIIAPVTVVEAAKLFSRRTASSTGSGPGRLADFLVGGTLA